MICPVCEGTGEWTERIEITGEVKVPGPCTKPNCIDGRYAVPFNPKRHRFGPSSLEHYQLAGCALCEKCAGRGCKACRDTGLKLAKCFACQGTNVEWTTKKVHQVYEGEKHKCIYCDNGNRRSSGGTLGELLSEALDLKRSKCNEIEQRTVGAVFEKMDGMG